MADNAEDLSWPQFMLGLAVLALALGVFEFVKYDASVSTYMRTLGAIAFALGNLTIYAFLGATLLGLVNLVRRGKKMPAPKFFALGATLLILALSIAIRM
ncbi:MAG: hypothetical protein PHG47_00430 [Sulfuricella sp.]|nr:hypothetical protein [Sulfuricella sp.]